MVCNGISQDPVQSSHTILRQVIIPSSSAYEDQLVKSLLVLVCPVVKQENCLLTCQPHLPSSSKSHIQWWHACEQVKMILNIADCIQALLV